MSQEQSQERPNQSSKSLFVVSSAIHAKHGVYDVNERLSQTIDTLHSIRNRLKDSVDIIVLDGGYKNIDQREKDQLEPLIDKFYNFSDNDTIKEIQKSSNWDIVKNSIELLMFGMFFDSQASELKEKYNRVFKMSGRYTLNDNFNYEQHLQAKNKVVIKGPYTSQFPSAVTGGATFQYMSRLWSFDSSLSFLIADMYKTMYNHMMFMIERGHYLDIEHLLCIHLKNQLVHLVSRIGVDGNIAPNGMRISD